ncbi:MAG: hypothetical protein AB7T37_15360 [Dehalococcoidia bacterium]
MVALEHDTDFHVALRIPGWLIVGVLVALLAWWLVAKTPWDSGGGIGGVQPTATLFQQSSDDGAWMGSVLVESDKSIEAPAEGWFLAGSDGAQMLTLLTRTHPAPAGTDGVVVELIATLPDGFEPAYLVRDGFTVLQSSLGGSGAE